MKQRELRVPCVAFFAPSPRMLVWGLMGCHMLVDLSGEPDYTVSVSTARGSGPQSCELSPAGLLSCQHFPPTGLPLGK